jgi:hypothetical protein
MSDDSVGWFSADAAGLEAGALVRRNADGTVHVTDSIKIAVAHSRGSEWFLYQVEPVDPPTEIGSPGLFTCDAATVVRAIDPPKWTQEELWPLVATYKWPDGSPMYTDDGRIAAPPGFPESESPRRLLQRRYLLPVQVERLVHDAARGPFGGGW